MWQGHRIQKGQPYKALLISGCNISGDVQGLGSKFESFAGEKDFRVVYKGGRTT